MEHKASAEDKPEITAIKPYADKQRNNSGWLTVTTDFLYSAYFFNSWIKHI
jgi:hypothetical protein